MPRHTHATHARRCCWPSCRHWYEYAAKQVRNPATGAVYILLEAQLDKIPGAVPKAKKGKGKAKDEPPEKGFEVRWHGVSLRLHDPVTILVMAYLAGYCNQCRLWRPFPC